MIKNFIERWYKNNDNLREYISTNPQENYDCYRALVKLVIQFILNSDSDDYSYNHYSLEDLIEIDNGDYHGTLLFITHRKTCQPSVEDYIITDVCYGSCSGCDTLLGIKEYGTGLPKEEQVNDYMLLCLHILQKFRYLRGAN